MSRQRLGRAGLEFLWWVKAVGDDVLESLSSRSQPSLIVSAASGPLSQWFCGLHVRLDMWVPEEELCLSHYCVHSHHALPGPVGPSAEWVDPPHLMPLTACFSSQGVRPSALPFIPSAHVY